MRSYKKCYYRDHSYITDIVKRMAEMEWESNEEIYCWSNTISDNTSFRK